MTSANCNATENERLMSGERGKGSGEDRVEERREERRQKHDKSMRESKREERQLGEDRRM